MSTKIALSTAAVAFALAAIVAFDATASVRSSPGRTAPIVPAYAFHVPVVHSDPGRREEVASTWDGAHAGVSSPCYGRARQEGIDVQACGSAATKTAAMVRTSDPVPTIFVQTPVHGGEVSL